MTQEDRRIKRTQRLLTQALLDLSIDRPYASISIRDMTERANVGYATFFRHYRSKEALLLSVLGETIEDLIRLIRPMTVQGKLQAAGVELFQYVSEHHMLVRMLLAAQGSVEVQSHMWKTAEQHILATNTDFFEGMIPAEIVARHLMVASTALIQWWLEQDMALSCEQMGYIFATLIAEPIVSPETVKR